MENGPFVDVLPIKMVIVNSYVNLPEGIDFGFDKAMVLTCTRYRPGMNVGQHVRPRRLS